METRACEECGEPLKGRTDKKFCSDMCRNAHHNKLNSEVSAVMRQINSILRRNRKILESQLRGDKTRLPKQTLIDRGFNFRYFTGQCIGKQNSTYTYCYEYGFTQVNEELVLLVKRNPE